MSVILDHFKALEEKGKGVNIIPKEWVLEKAKQAEKAAANGYGVATHIAKFVHSGASSSAVIAPHSPQTDGYLHSGNVKCDYDFPGNAAATQLFVFMLVKMNDGRTIIEHLKDNTPKIQNEFSFLDDAYDDVRDSFLQLQKGAPAQTDYRVRQVYFPLDQTGESGYHLLSLLTAGGMISRLRSEIYALRRHTAASRSKDSETYGQPYNEIYDLTEMAFGGSHAQNVSVLNQRNGGAAFLLSSLPPTIERRDVIRPKKDFFRNTLYHKAFVREMLRLHGLMKSRLNNTDVRKEIDAALQAIVAKVIDRAGKLQLLDGGWSQGLDYEMLAHEQKIWLDQQYENEREVDTGWQEAIVHAFADWLSNTYQYIVKDQSCELQDAEMNYIRNQVRKAI